MSGQPDVSFLPDELRQAMVATNTNEAMWPRQFVESAINALADHGEVILGLDLRSDGEGEIRPGLDTEVPWSIYQPNADEEAVDGGRRAALEALRRPNSSDFSGYRWVLVTWQPGTVR